MTPQEIAADIARRTTNLYTSNQALAGSGTQGSPVKPFNPAFQTQAGAPVGVPLPKVAAPAPSQTPRGSGPSLTQPEYRAPPPQTPGGTGLGLGEGGPRAGVSMPGKLGATTVDLQAAREFANGLVNRPASEYKHPEYRAALNAMFPGQSPSTPVTAPVPVRPTGPSVDLAGLGLNRPTGLADLGDFSNSYLPRPSTASVNATPQLPGAANRADLGNGSYITSANTAGIDRVNALVARGGLSSPEIEARFARDAADTAARTALYGDGKPAPIDPTQQLLNIALNGGATGDMTPTQFGTARRRQNAALQALSPTISAGVNREQLKQQGSQFAQTNQRQSLADQAAAYQADQEAQIKQQANLLELSKLGLLSNADARATQLAQQKLDEDLARRKALAQIYGEQNQGIFDPFTTQEQAVQDAYAQGALGADTLFPKLKPQ